MRIMRIGTRGSRLALAQTALVMDALGKKAPGVAFEVVRIKTTGDILSDRPLDVIGGKGVFVKDIERALLDGSIDIAVHSLKDMQAHLPDGLVIGAYLEREDPRDMVFSSSGLGLEELPEGLRVGTSSLRRKCQIRNARPDLQVVDIRGNVQTRLNRLGRTVDAVVLAAAGVARLGLRPGVALDPGVMVPSPGQGVIAVECRVGDDETMGLLSSIDHAQTRTCALAERAFLAELGQDCRLPAGALARLEGGSIAMVGMLGSADCRFCTRREMEGDGPRVGAELARALLVDVKRRGSMDA